MDDVMPRRDRLRIWKILKKSRQLSPIHGVEKLASDHGVENLRLDHAGRKLSQPLGHRELIFVPLQRRLNFSGPDKGT